jgi:hypothetical protein
MALLGFPSENELTSMLGYVTEEDRAKWDQQKDASDKHLEKARSGLTARGLASQAATPAISMAERSIQAQMTGAQTEERRNTRAKQTKRTVTTLETEEPVEEGFGMGY